MDPAYWDLIRRTHPNEYDLNLHEFAELEYPGESVEWVVGDHRPRTPPERPVRRWSRWARFRLWVSGA
jgi:hypothetical protein